MQHIHLTCKYDPHHTSSVKFTIKSFSEILKIYLPFAKRPSIQILKFQRWPQAHTQLAHAGDRPMIIRRQAS